MSDPASLLDALVPETVPVSSDLLLGQRPWRFKVGDWVYIYRQSQDVTFQVIGGELWRGFPHYLVRDTVTDDTWRVPQLHLSSKPIAFCKD